MSLLRLLKLKISKEHLDRIIRESKASRIEICGLLLGNVEGDVGVVEEIRFGKNIKSSTVEFEIDPTDLYEVLTYAEKKGLEVVGMFHSHPASAKPSKLDLKGMQLWPIPWLIVSSIDGSYDCFLLDLEKKRLMKVQVIVT